LSQKTETIAKGILRKKINRRRLPACGKKRSLKAMKTKIVIAIFILSALPGINRSFATMNTSGKGQVTGKIVNTATHKPVEDASIALFSATDSTLVAGTISDEGGFFKIFRLDTGRYYLVIDSKNFKSKDIVPFDIKQQSERIALGELSYLIESNKTSPGRKKGIAEINLETAILSKK
jgi:hypothetical protein